MERAITKEDAVITAYRCHGWTYLRGATVRSILAELMGMSYLCVCLSREREDGGGEEILSVVHVGEGMEGMNASLPPHRQKHWMCTGKRRVYAHVHQELLWR